MGGGNYPDWLNLDKFWEELFNFDITCQIRIVFMSLGPDFM